MEQVQVQSETEWKVQGFPIIVPAPLHTASSTITIPHQSGPFGTTEEPTLTRHSHPKSTVYIRGHSWCCPFCGSGQMWNDT